MPVAHIRHIGDVEYVVATLPSDIKGKAIIGSLTSPILISEELHPGTKLDYVVAHEVGHRLTIDMIANAYEEAPSFFDMAPDAPSGFIKYLINLGLNKNNFKPVHPGTKSALNDIFDENSMGNYTDEATALEFIAEVYANWATDTGAIPAAIAKRFKALTDSKNAILLTLSRAAAFDVGPPSDDWKNVWWVLGLIGVVVVLKNL